MSCSILLLELLASGPLMLNPDDGDLRWVDDDISLLRSLLVVDVVDCIVAVVVDLRAGYVLLELLFLRLLLFLLGEVLLFLEERDYLNTS